MNLHFTPSFNIDRLCKTASVLLFLVTIVLSVQMAHKNICFSLYDMVKLSQLREYQQVTGLPFISLGNSLCVEVFVT